MDPSSPHTTLEVIISSATFSPGAEVFHLTRVRASGYAALSTGILALLGFCSVRALEQVPAAPSLTLINRIEASVILTAAFQVFTVIGLFAAVAALALVVAGWFRVVSNQAASHELGHVVLGAFVAVLGVAAYLMVFQAYEWFAPELAPGTEMGPAASFAKQALVFLALAAMIYGMGKAALHTILIGRDSFVGAHNPDERLPVR